MEAAARQMKHHVKDCDKQAAKKSGDDPWFEAFLRIANEYDGSIGRMKQPDLTCRRQEMPLGELSSTVRKHSYTCPNSKGANWPPVLFAHNERLLVVDGNKRINTRLGASGDGIRSVEVIVVSQSITSQ